MADKITFYTDEHIAKAVIRGLRQRGVGVVTAPEADMLGAEDEAHLQFAAEQGRVSITQDRDFLRLHAAEISHAGIVYAPQQAPIGRIVSGVILI